MKKLIQNDPELNSLSKNRALKISTAINKCGSDIACLSSVFKFNKEEIGAVSKRLSILFKQDEALKK